MYDFGREPHPSLCEFKNNQISYYVAGTGQIQSVKKHCHHYESQTLILEMVQHITRELFYYSSSVQKVSKKQQANTAKKVLLKNIKRITAHNCDKYGLINEQVLFYLVVSYLQSRVSSKGSPQGMVQNNSQNTKYEGNDGSREFLMEAHYMLSNKRWQNPNQEIPYVLMMLLNGQYGEILSYVREELIVRMAQRQQQSQQTQLQLQFLIDLLIYKIQSKEQCMHQVQAHENNNNDNKQIFSNSTPSIINQLIGSINASDWLVKLCQQLKRHTQNESNIFFLFQQHELELILAILVGNQQVIESVCKGSWALYINLYMHFILPNHNTNCNFQLLVNTYLQKNSKHIISNGLQNHNQHVNPNQSFLLKLISSLSLHSTQKYSFHQLYQESFNTFSPILAQFIGLLLMECKLVDLYSIFNNKDYHEEILLNLIQSCNNLSWSALVHFLGFLKNTKYLQKQHKNQILWESFMFQHLPYEIQLDNEQNPLQNQIKEIQEKLEDLNIIGLSTITKSYLTTLFNLQLSPSNSNNKLNPSILQVFFLNLEMTNSQTANSSFHQMKSFLAQYYRNSQFDYDLLNCLQNIFERKRSILSEKMERKIQKLFCLPYKINFIQSKSLQIESQSSQQTIFVEQIKEFNKLFITSKNKKTISLSVELLKLAANLHRSIQNTIGFSSQVEMELQTNHEEKNKQEKLHVVKQFQKNLFNYLQEWKAYDFEHMENEPLSQTAIEQLAYFDQSFY